MDDIPLSIKNKCQELLGTSILSSKQIGGGDINQARLIETSKSKFFLKFNPLPNAFYMFQKEVLGLEMLRNADKILIPQIVGYDQTKEGSFLVLEYVESGHRKKGFWEKFGTQLASLHQMTQEKFGHGDWNYIGSLIQRNNLHDTWSEFFIQERLIPQIILANNGHRIQSVDNQSFEKLFKKIPQICPEEPPALTHGDLWSGNFMISSEGEPILIDPAVSFAHREMDLAMTRLFGGFDYDFYQYYHECFPLESGFNQRVEIYQLYYLMVHVNLFGGGYLNSVRKILKKFV